MFFLRAFTKVVAYVSLTLVFSANHYAQINEGEIVVRSISSVSWTRAFDEAGKEFEKKPGVEIELFTASQDGFYLEAISQQEQSKYIPYCVQIGNLKGVIEGGSKGKKNPNNKTRFFVLTKQEWNSLTDKAPIRLYRGCPKPSDYEILNPVGYLDKTLLDKPLATKCALPLEFAPKLQNLGLGFHVARVYERAYFNERKNSKTKILTLSYTGPENAEKLLPNYGKDYLRELKNNPSGFPGMISGIDEMTLNVSDDIIFSLRLTYSEPLKEAFVRNYVEEFSKKWALPMFWKYSEKGTKAELKCSNFKVEINSNKLKPEVILTITEIQRELNKIKKAIS